ncbi:MAG: hypothetical protein R6V58_17585 [Planctomycetota bacterium]
MLNDLFVVPDVGASRASIRFTAPDGSSGATWQILDADNAVAAGELALAPGEPARHDVEIPDPKLWGPGSPYLYTLTLTVDGADEPIDAVQPFGMRDVRTTPEAIWFNGRPLFVRGVIRGREAHDHENLDDLPLEEFYAKYIRAAEGEPAVGGRRRGHRPRRVPLAAARAVTAPGALCHPRQVPIIPPSGAAALSGHPS